MPDMTNLDTAPVADLEACLRDIRRANAAAGEELDRALANLLEQLRDGAVAADAAAALAADIRSRSADADAAQFADWAEWADALASGVGGGLPPLEPPLERAEPPLLTEREDGAWVAPGTFDDDPAAESAVPPQSVAAIVEGLDTVIGTFQDQVATLRRGESGPQASPDAMAANIDELRHLRQALADWMAASAALLDE